MGAEKLTYENIDPKVKKMAMAGIMLAMLVANLDNTIVGTCGTIIARDLNGMELYSWVITAYLLCETAMIPIAGKMSDHYGRKILLISGLSLFMIGSILSGLSWCIEALIGFRAIQGLGAGIIVPVATASVADFYAPADRGKMQGVMGAIFGIGSGAGPLVGGAICKFISWHWLFYINVPLIIICFILTAKRFPQSDEVSIKKIDYLGIAILTALILDILLFCQWLGDEVPFFGWKFFAMIALAVALVVLFVMREKKAEDPVMAPHLFHNPTVVKSSIFLFILGLAMIGTLTYIAMFIIYTYNYDTLQCGFTLLPMVIGMMLTSMGSGMMVAKTGYKKWIIAGSVLTTAALFLMSTLGSKSDLIFVLLYLLIFGLGLGCLNSTVMVAVQNNAKKGEIGMTTSTVSLFRTIGATVGTAIYSLVISNKMDNAFAASMYHGMEDAFNFHGTGILTFIQIFPNNMPLCDFIRSIFADGLCMAFIVAGVLFVIALIIGSTMSSKYEIMDE